MTLLPTRTVLVSAALLLGVVGSATTAAAATGSPRSLAVTVAGHHRLHPPAHHFWRSWRGRRPADLFVVVSDIPSGGLFGTGQLAVENAAHQTITLNLDNLTRAYVTRGFGGGIRYRIAPTALQPGDFIVVAQREVINLDPTTLLALRIEYTGFSPTAQAPPPPLSPPPPPPPPAPVS